MSVVKSRRQESDYEIFEKSKTLFAYTYNRVKLFNLKDIPYFSIPLYELSKSAYFEIRKILYDKDEKTHCLQALINYDQMLELIDLAYSEKINKLPSSVFEEWISLIEEIKKFLIKKV